MAANSTPKVVSDVETVDTKVLETNATTLLNRKEQARKNLVQTYLKEDKMPVTVSPFYAPFFGKVVPVLVNGIRVDIPADGKTYHINATHAGEIIAKIRKIDQMIERQKRAGDVSNNLEHTPGELQI